MSNRHPNNSSRLYQRVWRWHFYAGLMVMPFAIILALSGSVYLFKSQIEGYQQDSINQLARVTSGTALSADQLLAGLLAAYPEGQFKSYTLATPGDVSVEIELQLPGGPQIFWLNQFDGSILFKQKESEQLLSFVKDIHGELLAGNVGSYVVELMASWMIVLIISGWYLWWPQDPQLSWLAKWRARLLPAFRQQSARQRWRNLHGMLGSWLSVMVLILLLSGLPWTQLWGAGFDKVQTWLAMQGPGQEFRVTLQSSAPAEAAMHDEHRAHQSHDDGIAVWQRGREQSTTFLQSSASGTAKPPLSLQQVIELQAHLAIVAPVLIYPPQPNNGVWTVRGMSQNRPLRQTVHFDQWAGDIIMHIRFSDYPLLKRLTSYGIALHEGALFGWLNQLLGVVTALGIVVLCVSGGLMWWRRRPPGKLAAPKKTPNHRLSLGLSLIVLCLALFLPMVALTLIVVAVLDWLAIRLLARSSPQ